LGTNQSEIHCPNFPQKAGDRSEGSGKGKELETSQRRKGVYQLPDPNGKCGVGTLAPGKGAQEESDFLHSGTGLATAVLCRVHKLANKGKVIGGGAESGKGHFYLGRDQEYREGVDS